MSNFITKSLHKLFKRCPRLLALTVKHPELKDAHENELATFLSGQGHRVERIVQDALLENGAIEIPAYPTQDALKRTLAAINSGTTVVEGSFAAGNAFARADVFVVRPGGELREIKSCTHKKDEHVDDTAFQLYVIRKNGISVEGVTLAMVNRDFVLKTPTTPLSTLITDIDLTAEAEERLLTIPKDLTDMAKIISQRKLPRRNIGRHCEAPYSCPFIAHCLADCAEDSILNLRRAGQLKFDLHHEGIRTISAIPAHVRLTPFQRIQAKAEAENGPIVDKAKLQAFIDAAKYPRYFLDFEASVEAIPRYVGTGPYQQIPFQASVHAQRSEDAPLEHFAFLHDKATDPRPALSRFLAKTIGNSGSVIVYHASYERSRLQDMAALGEGAGSKLTSIVQRLVDLETPFEKGWYLDPKFEGSSSIKYVLPVLVPHLSYKELAIQNGTAASINYLEMISATTSVRKRAAIRKALLDYCKLDTLAMVRILSFLMEVVK